MLNLPHALSHSHDHILQLIIVGVDIFPHARMGGVLALPQAVKEKAGVPTHRFFNQAQRRVAPLPVPFVWDAMNMNRQNAQPRNYGMERRPSYEGTNKRGSSFSTTSQSVSISRPWQDAQIHHTHLDTFAQGVERQNMAPSTVPRHRKTNSLTPLQAGCVV